MELLIILGINILTSILKKYVKPKFGTTGVHVFVFAVALMSVVILNAKNHYPLFNEWVTSMTAYAISAIATYEVLFKRLDIDKLLGSDKI